MVVVSPYAKKAYVSKTVHTHTSIGRFIEALFDLPAMSARDANSDALLDMFDFGCAPGTPNGAPAAGTGGCSQPDGGASDAGDAAPNDAAGGG
jgi:phospholipase C